MKFNKGEWSELYTILYLLNHNTLEIVDYELKPKLKNIFLVKEIILKEDIENLDTLKFSIDKNKSFKLYLNETSTIITEEEIRSIADYLISTIKTQKNSGAFEIEKVNQWLKKYNISNIKGDSQSKADIFLLNFDNYHNDTFKLGYSIKSKLGSPATILNASKQTNFKYIVEGLDNKDIREINSINSKTKLKDRITAIQEKGGRIIFDRITSPTFKKNLEYIDMCLPDALGEILLTSYKDSQKNLKILFENSSIYNSEELSKKKLEDFLLAISLGMRPSEPWYGDYEADGSILIVNNDSKVYTLDMKYNLNDVKTFLVSQTRLDSPSSTRYNMLDLKEENGKICFTLNLQIRYRK